MFCAACDLIQFFLRIFVIDSNRSNFCKTIVPVIICCSHLVNLCLFLLLGHFAPAYICIFNCICIVIPYFICDHRNGLRFYLFKQFLRKFHVKSKEWILIRILCLHSCLRWFKSTLYKIRRNCIPFCSSCITINYHSGLVCRNRHRFCTFCCHYGYSAKGGYSQYCCCHKCCYFFHSEFHDIYISLHICPVIYKSFCVFIIHALITVTVLYHPVYKISVKKSKKSKFLFIPVFFTRILYGT